MSCHGWGETMPLSFTCTCRKYIVVSVSVIQELVLYVLLPVYGEPPDVCDLDIPNQDDDSIPLTTSNALTTMSSDTKHGYMYVAISSFQCIYVIIMG